MQIVEQFSAPKGPGASNEDRICITGSFAAVADGVTSIRRSRIEPSPGSLAAEAICREVETLEPDCDAIQAVELMSKAVRFAGGRSRQLAASVVIYSKVRREIWAVGDCRYLAGEVRHEPEHPVDSLLKRLRSFVICTEIAGGADEVSLRMRDKGREAIQGFLRRQRVFANSDSSSQWAYGVIDGQRVPLSFVHVFNVPAHVSEIVLASDGYPRVESTLARSEEALSRIVSEDPLCYRLHLGTKCVPPGATAFDDRSYLRLQVGS